MSYRNLLLPAVGLVLALGLAACAPAASPPPESSAPVAESPSARPEAETSVQEGTLNTVDTGLDYLALVDQDGNYCRFDLNGVDASGLEPGDLIAVTYTGQLSDGDELTAVVTALEKRT